MELKYNVLNTQRSFYNYQLNFSNSFFILTLSLQGQNRYIEMIHNQRLYFLTIIILWLNALVEAIHKSVL